MLNKISHRTKPFHPHEEHRRSCVPRVGSKGMLHPISILKKPRVKWIPAA